MWKRPGNDALCHSPSRWDTARNAGRVGSARNAQFGLGEM